MNFVLEPWQLLLFILAGWINRNQQDAIEYLLTENQVVPTKNLIALKSLMLSAAAANLPSRCSTCCSHS